MINTVEVQAKTITMHYFEPGHSFMPADQVHAKITVAINKENSIGDFKDYISVICNSRDKITATALDHNDFIKFTSGVRSKHSMKLSAVRVVQFRRGSTSLFVKESYSSDEFREEDILTLKAKKTINAAIEKAEYQEGEDVAETDSRSVVRVLNGKLYPTGPRGISLDKKKDLLKLAKGLHGSRVVFFHSLTCSEEVKDLEVHV